MWWFCRLATHTVLHPTGCLYLQVKGKLNAITIDECTSTGLVFQDLVASCELVNSSGLQVQVIGLVPTVAVDKCDGIQVGPSSTVHHVAAHLHSVCVHLSTNDGQLAGCPLISCN